MSVVGKIVCNNRLVERLDKEGILQEGQAGFRVNRSCMDNVFTLNELVQEIYILFRYAEGIRYGMARWMMINLLREVERLTSGYSS